MTQVAHATFGTSIALHRLPARPAAKAARPGFLRRLYDAIMQANERQAERDLARFVSTRGKFTDSIERDISHRLLGGQRNWFD